MFAYCLNNPVAHSDHSGNLTIEVTVVAGFVVVLLVCGVIVLSHEVVKTLSDFWGYISTKWYYGIARISFIYKSDEKKIAQAEKEIQKTVKRNSKVRYWTATVHSDYVDIGRPLTFSQAVKEVQAGRSVFAVTWYEAKAVAIAAGGESGYNNKQLQPEIDKGQENTPGYYYHYHTYNRSGGHVYFLFGEA